MVSIRSTSFVTAALAASAILNAGCDRSAYVAPPPPPPQEVVLRITSDEEAVGNVQVTGTGFDPAVSNDKGEAKIMLAGPDGTQFDLNINCPETYASPQHSTKVTVRRSSKTPEYNAECRRLGRIAVVAIHSTDPLGKTPYAGLPVRYLGREIGRLDENGMALVSFHARIGDSFTVQLDTSDPKYQFMRPQNPEKTFSIRDDDDIFVLHQTFTEEKPQVRKYIARGPSLPKPL